MGDVDVRLISRMSPLRVIAASNYDGFASKPFCRWIVAATCRRMSWKPLPENCLLSMGSQKVI